MTPMGLALERVMQADEALLQGHDDLVEGMPAMEKEVARIRQIAVGADYDIHEYLTSFEGFLLDRKRTVDELLGGWRVCFGSGSPRNINVVIFGLIRKI